MGRVSEGKNSHQIWQLPFLHQCHSTPGVACIVTPSKTVQLAPSHESITNSGKAEWNGFELCQLWQAKHR